MKKQQTPYRKKEKENWRREMQNMLNWPWFRAEGRRGGRNFHSLSERDGFLLRTGAKIHFSNNFCKQKEEYHSPFKNSEKKLSGEGSSFLWVRGGGGGLIYVTRAEEAKGERREVFGPGRPL